MNKNNVFLIFITLFMSSWYCPPLGASFFTKHATKKNILMGLVGVTGLLLIYWYFKKPKKVEEPEIPQRANEEQEAINISINISENSEKNNEKKEIIITQENLENADLLMQELQNAAIQIGTVIENLKYYELEKEKSDLALKALNENNVKLAQLLSKNNIENDTDKRWAKAFIQSTGMILGVILSEIQNKMKKKRDIIGKKTIHNIKTLNGKCIPVDVDFFREEDGVYFSISDILNACFLQLKNKNNNPYYNNDLQEIVPQDNLNLEHLTLVIAGKGYKNTPDKLILVSEWAQMNCLHLIIRKPGLNQN